MTARPVELQQCASKDVARKAHDLGVTPNELTSPAGNGPDSAKPIDKLLAVLGVDRTRRPFNEPALIEDLHRLCVMCDHKLQCAHELAAGTAAAHYGSYCPTA